MKLKHTHYVAVLTVLSACAAETSSPTETEEAETAPLVTTALTDAQILAEVRTSPDEFVQFIEGEPGKVTIAAIGKGDPKNSPLAQIEPAPLDEVYLTLGGKDEAVVARLRGAQLRSEALRAELASLPPGTDGKAPEVEAGGQLEVGAAEPGVVGTEQAIIDNSGGTHEVVTDSEFAALYCNAAQIGADGEYCATFATNGNTGWSADITWIRSIVIALKSAGAIHRLQQWTCLTSVFGVCVQGDWRAKYAQNIPKWHYGIFVDNFKWTKFAAAGNSGTTFHMGAVWFF